MGGETFVLSGKIGAVIDISKTLRNISLFFSNLRGR